MKIGLFGGSFDPIHAGHIAPVKAAAETFGLDRVVYLPTARPPHKTARRMAPAWARYVMVELALLEEPLLHVSPHEMTLDRPAYTVESVEHFAREHPGAELYLLLGLDSFLELPTWRRWRELADLAVPVVMARVEAAGVAGLDPVLADWVREDRVLFVANPPVDISATELRDGLSRGETPPPGAMPPAVVQYLRKYSLYR